MADEPASDPGRWQRRQQRRRAERERLQKHGAGIRRVYRDAILNRLRARKPGPATGDRPG